MDHKRKDGQKMSLTKQPQHNILNTTTGDKMQVGDLVKCKYSHELFVIISEEHDSYHDVYGLTTGKTWLMPQEHLEVICK